MTTGYVSGSISLGRETTCLAESYHVGGYWIDEVDEVDEVDDGTKHSIHEEKRRIVGSPKTWGSVAFIYPSAKPRNPFGPSHLRWPHVTHSTSSQLPTRAQLPLGP